jgi:hypothetical protein
VLRRLGVATLFALVLLPHAGFGQWPPPPRDEWDAELSIHGWLWSSKGTAEVLPPQGGVPVDASFGNMDGPLDPGGSVRIETKTSLSTLMIGATYLHLDQEREVEFEGGTARGELNTTQWVLDAGASYRLARDFELLGAARYYLIRTDSRFGSVEIANEDRSWMDVFLGGRVTSSHGPVTLSIRGDIGAGGSNLAWFGNAVLAYRMGGRTSLRAEYRILSADREGKQSSEHLGWDVVQNGLGLGIGLGF